MCYRWVADGLDILASSQRAHLTLGMSQQRQKMSDSHTMTGKPTRKPSAQDTKMALSVSMQPDILKMNGNTANVTLRKTGRVRGIVQMKSSHISILTANKEIREVEALTLPKYWTTGFVNTGILSQNVTTATTKAAPMQRQNEEDAFHAVGVRL